MGSKSSRKLQYIRQMSNCFPSFILRWILNFMDQPSHENHKYWHPTNNSDFTISKCRAMSNELFNVTVV